MSVSAHKILLSQLKQNEKSAKDELLERLQHVLDDARDCGLVLTIINDDDEYKITNSSQDFNLETELEYIERYNS